MVNVLGFLLGCFFDMTTEYGLKEMEKEYGPLTFGKALWAHRKCEENSQKDFAKMLGISLATLRDLEKGRRIPSVKMAAKIGRILELSEKTWARLAAQDMERLEDIKLAKIVKEKDVCDVLGLSNPTMAIESLDDDERSKFNLGRQGGESDPEIEVDINDL